MNGARLGMYARCGEWLLRHNPLYLLSAALMALGARLCLVDPTDAAGDVAVILLTLAVLQAYEWAVGAVLLLLHRHRRAPEDEPSLLLVSALFWTGPLAATIEMTAAEPDLGMSLAAGASVIALAEFWTLRRILRLRFSLVSQLVAAACLLLLVAAPPLVRIPEPNDGRNELYLYAAWWILAGITLACLAIRPPRTARVQVFEPPTYSPDQRRELIFLGLTLTATAVHLIAMNHGFFCHARLFYASPLLVAASAFGVDRLLQADPRHRWLLAPCAAQSGLALLFTLESFDRAVPVRMLPPCLRDPMLTVALFTAAVWWLGYARHRALPLFHLGSAAFAVAIFRTVKLYSGTSPDVFARGGELSASQTTLAVGFLVLAGYLALTAWLRRSRVEAVLAVIANQIALTIFICDRAPTCGPIICLTGAWSLLLALHLGLRRPSLTLRLLPFALILAIPLLYDSTHTLRWPLRVHTGYAIVLLFIVGQYYRWTHYRLLAGVLLLTQAVFFGTRWALHHQHGTAIAIIATSFAALSIGTLMSWHKRRLLELLRPEEPQDLDG